MTTFVMIVAAVFAVALFCALVFGIFRLGRGRLETPSCPRCGYDASKLPQPICSECGLDLDRAGVLAAGRLRPMGAGRRLALLSLIVLPVGVLTSGTVERNLDRILPSPTTCVVSATYLEPESVAYKSICVTGMVSAARFPSLMRWTITLKDLEDQLHVMQYDPETGVVWYDEGNGLAGLGLDPQRTRPATTYIWNWMLDTGITGDSKQLAVEAKYVATMMQTRLPIPDRTSRGFGSLSIAGFNQPKPFANSTCAETGAIVPDSWREPRVLYFLLIAPWSLLWALGAVFILWRARRRQRLLSTWTVPTSRIIARIVALLGRRTRLLPARG